MANTATLAVRIVSDSAAARADIGKSSDAVGKWGDRATKVGKFAGKALAGGILAAGAAAVKFTQAAAEDAASAEKLSASLKKAAGATDDQVASVEKWIEAQGKALGVADDELRPALSRLATVTGSVTKAQKLASLAMNIAAATGKPLKTVTEGLAKAQTGSIAGLAKFGVQVKNSKGETKGLDTVMRDLSKTYSGSAAKAADTAAGRQKRLAVTMGELQEKIGAKLLPVMEKLIEVGFKVIDWIDQNQKTVGYLLIALGSLMAATWLTTTAIAAWTTVTKIAAAAQKIWTAAQWAFNAAMAANPIGLIIIAVIALIAGFVLLYKKSDRFRTIVQAVGRAGAAAVRWIVDVVSDLVGWVRDKLPGAWSIAKTLIVGYVKLVTLPIRTVLGVIKDVVTWAKDKVPKAFSAMKDKAVEIGGALLAPFQSLLNLIKDIIDWISKIDIPDLPDVSKLDPRNWGRAIASSTPDAGSVFAPARSVTVQVNGSLIGLSEDGVARQLIKIIDRENRIFST